MSLIVRRKKGMESPNTKSNQSMIRQGIIAGLASFASLSAIFVAAMLNLSEAVDWPYLQWAVLRIIVTSALLGAIFSQLREMRPGLTAIAGAVGGTTLGIIYVAIFSNA